RTRRSGRRSSCARPRPRGPWASAAILSQAGLTAPPRRAKKGVAMLYRRIPSPFGSLLLAGDDKGLRRIHFERPGHLWTVEADWEPGPDRFGDAARQLELYFLGRLRAFDLCLAPEGTPFQLRVWDAVTQIAYGE